MTPNSLPHTEAIKPGWMKSLSAGVLVVEATIATVVLSVFAASSPKLFTTQVEPTVRPAVAQDATSPQQGLSMHQPQTVRRDRDESMLYPSTLTKSLF